MAKKSHEESLYGGVTHRQYEFLCKRMECDSDSETARELGIPIDTVKTWKDSPSFSSLHKLVISDPIKALPVLSLHLASKALNTVKKLLDSDTVGGMKAGFAAWKELVDIAIKEKEDDVDPKILVQILTARGGIADAILEASGTVGQARILPPSQAGGNSPPPGQESAEGEWREVPRWDDRETMGEDPGGERSIMDGATITRRYVRPT